MCHTDTIWVFLFLCLKLCVFLGYLCNVYSYLIMIVTRNATHNSPCPLGPFRKIIQKWSFTGFFKHLATWYSKSFGLTWIYSSETFNKSHASQTKNLPLFNNCDNSGHIVFICIAVMIIFAKWVQYIGNSTFKV